MMTARTDRSMDKQMIDNLYVVVIIWSLSRVAPSSAAGQAPLSFSVSRSLLKYMSTVSYAI